MDFKELSKVVKQNIKNKKETLVSTSSGVLIIEKINKRTAKVRNSGQSPRTLPFNQLPSVVENVFAISKDSDKKATYVYDGKEPTSSKKHIGVELEFISKLKRSVLSVLIADAGLEKHVELKDDGSLSGRGEYSYTHEACILGDEESIFDLIRRFTKVLKGNSTVNKTCGMHVHLDMRSRDVKKAYANLYSAQPLLYSMCPPTRSNNHYCRPETDYSIMSEYRNDSYDCGGDNEYCADSGYCECEPSTDSGYDRYVGINKDAYSKFNTLEVRIHSSTLEATKINNWIALLIKIADTPKAKVSNVRLVKSYKSAKKKFDIKGNLAKYVKERLVKFKDGNHDSEIKMAA